MSVEVFREVAETFLGSAEYCVLTIKGSWGVGKTYAWHKLAKDLGERMWPTTYSYASLFGLSSIADVRRAIIAGMTPATSLSRGMSLATVNESWLTILNANLGRMSRAMGAVLGSSKYGQYVTLGLDTIAPWLIRDMVICLDDFERVGDGLGHDELMGFISSLKETERCKVVLIMNDEKLPATDNPYSKYREKVVDLELKFAPTTEEAISWGLPQDLPLRADIVAGVGKLKISNIRILKKIASITRLLAEHFTDVRPEVQRDAVMSGVVICWALYDQTGKTPAIEFLKRWNTYVYFMEENKNKERTDDEKRWAGLLNDFGFIGFDDFDSAILKVVEQGYAQESGIDGQFAARNLTYVNGDLGDAFRGAWEMFHESFENNANDVANTMHARARQAISILNPSDLDAAVSLLRKLNRDDLADDLITYYVEQRRGDRHVFDLGSNPFGNQVHDERLRDALEAEYTTAPPTVTLHQAIETMAKERGWSKEDSRVVEAATADQLYAVFKGPLDVRRRKAIDACLRHAAQPQSKARPRVIEALRRIANEAPINRLRLEGIAGLEEEPLAEADTTAGEQLKS